jgi:diguanylate cyclase (GGDEF)-like protein/PAS domain S-box-containing protein
LDPLQSLIRRWSLNNLSVGMAIVMAAGLLVPVLIGLVSLSILRDRQIEQELDAGLVSTVTLLSRSLPSPVWNYDSKSIDNLAQASLLDKAVVRITIKDAAGAVLLELIRPERRLGHSKVMTQQLILSGDTSNVNELAGSLDMEVDDGLKRREFARDLQSYMVILLGQFLLSLGLILMALHIRVLKPLAMLARFSNQMAAGKFDNPLQWRRNDEISQLAHHMDQMRGALKSSFSEQRAILDNVQVGVVFVKDKSIHLANRYAEGVFGFTKDTMAGNNVRALFQSDEQYLAVSERIVATDGLYEEVLYLQRTDTSVFWAQLRCSSLESTQPEYGSIWVIEDISHRKAAEDEINKLAFYDSLTLLPNRRLLLDRLKRALVSSARTAEVGALLFIDLDEFKTLNDTLGHDVGDLLLQEVAKRLLTCVRERDTVARLGGDEFVVMLEGLSANNDDVAQRCELVGEKILTTLGQPYSLGGHDVRSTPSIGVTLFDGQINLIDELLKQADLAMYQSKAAGRNTLRFFDAAMQGIVNDRAALETDLREAIRQGQFVLNYQPQIIGADRLVGAEALVRWNHPQRGMVSPAAFIPLAEETGLILPLGNWVLETACMQLAAWAAQPLTSQLSIAVNVSAKQLHQNDFVEQILDILQRTGANPTLLKLELTESLLVTNIENTIAKMALLKSKGVGFSLDDFGTGYSSLTYLKRLPLDQLKIDQGFVRDVLIDPNDAAIAKMIIALAASLGLTVIAEGVELKGQLDFLASQGCHAYQGFYFSKPVPIAEFEEFAQAIKCEL